MDSLFDLAHSDAGYAENIPDLFKRHRSLRGSDHRTVKVLCVVHPVTTDSFTARCIEFSMNRKACLTGDDVILHSFDFMFYVEHCSVRYDLMELN